MVLPSTRKRRDQAAALEAEGQRLWVDEVPRQARVKIATQWEGMAREGPFPFNEDQTHVAEILRREEGRDVRKVTPEQFIASSGHYALDIIGALCLLFSIAPNFPGAKGWPDFVNNVLEDYRVAYRVVDDELVPIESDELHVEVTVPVLGLLVGDRFGQANRAYGKALNEIPTDPSDAITDAATALEETLVALGCKGNSLGDLIKDARKTGLLAAHDAKLEAGIFKFLDWASADRSQSGDGHRVSDASRADAWLMVHIVGALIIRLVDPGQARSPVGYLNQL